MLLFRDEEHITRWCGKWNQPKGQVLTIEQTWELAVAFYSKKMRADWRRLTVDEIEELFAKLGLTGSFWNVRA